MLVRQALTEPSLQFPESVFLLLYSSEAHFPLLSFLQARTFHLSPLPRSLSTWKGGAEIQKYWGQLEPRKWQQHHPEILPVATKTVELEAEISHKLQFPWSSGIYRFRKNKNKNKKPLFCQSSLYLILYDHQEGYRLPLHYSAT